VRAGKIIGTRRRSNPNFSFPVERERIIIIKLVKRPDIKMFRMLE
jgi:hypothetical protein